MKTNAGSDNSNNVRAEMAAPVAVNTQSQSHPAQVIHEVSGSTPAPPSQTSGPAPTVYSTPPSVSGDPEVYYSTQPGGKSADGIPPIHGYYQQQPQDQEKVPPYAPGMNQQPPHGSYAPQSPSQISAGGYQAQPVDPVYPHYPAAAPVAAPEAAPADGAAEGEITVGCCGTRYSKKSVIIVLCVVLLVVILAVGLGAGLGSKKKKKDCSRCKGPDPCLYLACENSCPDVSKLPNLCLTDIDFYSTSFCTYSGAVDWDTICYVFDCPCYGISH